MGEAVDTTYGVYGIECTLPVAFMAVKKQARFLLGKACFREECSKINVHRLGKYMYPAGHIPRRTQGHRQAMLTAIAI